MIYQTRHRSFGRHALARWLGESGDRAGAVAAFEALLTDRLRVLGPDHPDTLANRNILTYWREVAHDSMTLLVSQRRARPRRGVVDGAYGAGGNDGYSNPLPTRP
jgi:hypothetical protein